MGKALFQLGSMPEEALSMEATIEKRGTAFDEAHVAAWRNVALAGRPEGVKKAEADRQLANSMKARSMVVLCLPDRMSRHRDLKMNFFTMGTLHPVF
jgi:hypothetical protein